MDKVKHKGAMAIAVAMIAQALGVPLALPPSPALAQAASGVCLTSAGLGGNGTIIIVVRPEFQATMVARGFAVTACPEGGVNNAAFKQKICTQATTAPPPLRARFQTVYSTSLEELCAMAAE